MYVNCSNKKVKIVWTTSKLTLLLSLCQTSSQKNLKKQQRDEGTRNIKYLGA